MTFKQAVQIQIKALDAIRYNAGALWDLATSEEKEAFNYLRGHIIPIIDRCQAIADMPDSVDRTLKGDYSISVKLEDVL